MDSLSTPITMFYFNTIKMKCLNMFTILFYFSSIKVKSVTMLNTLF